MSDLRQTDLFPGTSIVLRPGVSEEILAAALEAMEMVRDPYADNTRIAYKRAHRRYGKWCDEAGVKPLPCSADQLVFYLQWLTRQPDMSPSSVLQAASAIASLDKFARVTPEDDRPVSVLKSVAYQRWLHRWQKTYGRKPKRKAPVFSRVELERVIAATREPTAGASKASWQARSARDRALWLMGIAGALRVNELAALELGHVVRVPEGLVVTLAASKTDQAGEGFALGIEPSASHHLCPVRAWEAWVLERGEWSGAAFVGISRDGEMQSTAWKGKLKNHSDESHGHRLTTRALQGILQANAARAGVAMSAHSLRRVFATTVMRQRKRLDKMMLQGRWTRVETVRGYIESAGLFEDNPTRGLFEGDW